MKRHVHDDHRLLPRYKSNARPQSTSSAASGRVYSTNSSTPVSDATDAWALRGFPVIVQDGVGGTIPGTQPEEALVRKAENEGW